MKEEKYDKALSCQYQRQGFEPRKRRQGIVRYGCVVCLLRCFAEHKLPLETGLVGFEPTNDGVKVHCLTAWL